MTESSTIFYYLLNQHKEADPNTRLRMQKSAGYLGGASDEYNEPEPSPPPARHESIN
jgi:hypothetical protein